MVYHATYSDFWKVALATALKGRTIEHNFLCILVLVLFHGFNRSLCGYFQYYILPKNTKRYNYGGTGYCFGVGHDFGDPVSSHILNITLINYS